MTLRLKIEFMSDWHIGSGSAGMDGADRGVVRDHHGFPYVPAKSLTGVLRDALEVVVTGLGEGWSEWVDVVFGSQPASGKGSALSAPRPAAVSIRPGFVTDSLKTALDDDMKRRHLTHVKAGVQIDKSTGTARERHLNFIEVNRPVVLWSHVEVDVAAEHRQTVLALLAAACAFTESIGGRRRKGLGRCRVQLFENGGPIDVDVEDSLPLEAPEVPEESAPAERTSSWIDDGSALVALDVSLIARTPLLVSATSVGNVVMSGDAIAGAALLPHLHRWIEAVGGNARELISSNRAMALRAVPQVDGARALPAPFVLQRPKDGASRTWKNSASSNAVDDVITKQVRSGWLSGNGPEFSYVGSLVRTVVTHNVVDDEFQKPTSDVGLYTYVALQAGSTFNARFFVPETLRSRIAEAAQAEGSIRVGRSKKDDYGWLDVRVIESLAGYPQSEPRSDLVVWAAADVLPRTAVSAVGWMTDLCNEVGAELGSVEVDPDRSRVRFARVDSWHSGWGFPRPSLDVISAGSCLVLKVTDPEAGRALRNLSGRCVGRRSAEGFGEISVDHPVMSAPEIDVDSSVPEIGGPVESPADLLPEEKRFVVAVNRSAVRQKIRASAIAARSAKTDGPNDTSWRSLVKVERSQLGRLRGWVQFIDAPLQGEAVKQLDHDIRHWQDQNAKRVVKKMLTDEGWIWSALNLDSSELASHEGTELSSELWGDAIRAFVETVGREATRGDN